MSKPIKELIKEARELDINIHDHVAKEMFGDVNIKTRHQAKALAFCELYGGSPSQLASKTPGPNFQNSTTPWTMTEEQIKAQTPREFKNTCMNEPFTHFDDCPAVDIPSYRPPTAKQPEDRMHRVGVVPFEVGIFDDDGLVSTLQVHATSALDARCIAYIIDRGRKMQQWDSEQIELALACTEVVG